MEPMPSQQRGFGEDPLDSVWKQYRDACAAPEASVEFMPRLWARIEARRNSSVWFRRWAEVCLVATLALAALLGFLVIPRYQEVAYQHYVDVLSAADSARDTALIHFEIPGEQSGEAAGELE